MKSGGFDETTRVERERATKKVEAVLSYYVLLLSGLDSINFDSYIVNKPSINIEDTSVLCGLTRHVFAVLSHTQFVLRVRIVEKIFCGFWLKEKGLHAEMRKYHQKDNKDSILP